MLPYICKANGHEVMERETSKFTDDIFKIRDKFVTDGMIVTLDRFYVIMVSDLFIIRSIIDL